MLIKMLPAFQQSILFFFQVILHQTTLISFVNPCTSLHIITGTIVINLKNFLSFVLFITPQTPEILSTTLIE